MGSFSSQPWQPKTSQRSRNFQQVRPDIRSYKQLRKILKRSQQQRSPHCPKRGKQLTGLRVHHSMGQRYLQLLLCQQESQTQKGIAQACRREGEVFKLKA